jgi:hypothetical protein
VSLVLSKASNLSEDLVDDENMELEDHMDLLLRGEKHARVLEKKTVDRLSVRRGVRI